MEEVFAQLVPARKPPPGLLVLDCVEISHGSGSRFILVFLFPMLEKVAVTVASVNAVPVGHNPCDCTMLGRYVIRYSDRETLPPPSETASSILIHSFDEAEEITDQEQSAPSKRHESFNIINPVRRLEYRVDVWQEGYDSVRYQESAGSSEYQGDEIADVPNEEACTHAPYAFEHQT